MGGRNTSGVVGVKATINGKWGSSIYSKGKTYNLGTYDNLTEAEAVRKDAERHKKIGDLEVWHNEMFPTCKTKKERVRWNGEMIGKEVGGHKILSIKRENNKTYAYTECVKCKKRRWQRTDNITCDDCSYEKQRDDISNERFGRLVALEPTNEREKNGSVVWKCKCDCENICYVSAKNLKQHFVRSCGCLSSEVNSRCGKDVGEFVANIHVIDHCNIKNLTAKMLKNNKSGVKGVSFDKTRKTWRAQIDFKGAHYCKSFKNFDDAVQKRKEWEEEFFAPFLKAHGKSKEK